MAQRRARLGRAEGARLPRLLRSQLALRVLSGALAVPLVVVAILAGGEWLAALVALVLVGAVYEFALGMGLTRGDPVVWLAAAGAAAMAGVALTRDVPTVWPLTAAILAIGAAPLLGELRRGDGAPAPASFEALYQRVASGLVALIYIGWLGSFLVLLRQLPAGEEWLLLAVFSVMATDSGAFAVGRLAGRHPLAPRISPAKTLEGAAGGWAAGFAAVLLIGLLPDLDVALWRLAILAIVLPPIAQIGDLTGSLIKRAADVKDFSRLIPGHGGLLDRLDSLLFGAPSVYLFVLWIVL